jgi:hypothetical protein
MIIHKPKGVDVPGIVSLSQCASSNPHGVGFMIAANNKVLIHKGLMKVDQLMDAVNILSDTLKGGIKDKEMVFHFRQATHGSVSVANCHPFPISDDDEELSAEMTTAEFGIVHNGVIFIKDRKQDESDTYTFVKKYLSKFDWNGLLAVHALLDDEVFRSDRVIIMNGAGEIIKWGHWTLDDDGCFYSNGYKGGYGHYDTEYGWMGHGHG